MSAIAPLIDQLCDGDVVDTFDLALVSGSSPRSVIRRRTGGTEPQREAESRILELRSVIDLAAACPEAAHGRFAFARGAGW